VAIIKADLVLIRGLPGSGKSTVARTMSGYKHFEADMYFERHGNYFFETEKIQYAHGWCYEKVKDALNLGHKVVVSNTFVQLWELEPYIRLVKDNNLTMDIIVASGKWRSIHNVPIETIVMMQDSWEA
jgi:predicted kinase